MSRRLRDVLSEFAEGEGRRSSGAPADADPVVRQLEVLIGRRRAMRASVISLAAVVLLLSSVAGANALMRQDQEPAAVATHVSSDPSSSAASEHANGKPSASASASASPSATPTPSASAVPTEETITPSWDPADAPVQLAPGTIVTTLIDDLDVRWAPDLEVDAVIALPKGTGFTIVEGPVLESGYWWYLVTDFTAGFAWGDTQGWIASAGLDGSPWIGPAPAQCTDAGFITTEPTVSSLAELQAGIVGTWRGCVTTPWVAPYEVTFTFDDDGTYSATAQPGANGDRTPALYYGVDTNSPLKVYSLDDFQSSQTGTGRIDILFGGGNVVRNDALQSVRLMGDELQFDFVHAGTYGPVTYRLHRVG